MSFPAPSLQGGTYLSLSLPQDRVRYRPRPAAPVHGRVASVLGHLCEAARMECPIAYARGVCPYPFLCLIKPLGDKFLLANGAERVRVVSILGDRDILDLWAGRCGS